MNNYLWELNIENIPLGWQETLDKAIQNCPDGELVAIPDIDFHSDKFDISRYYYNPIKFREKIIRLFNEEKNKAIHLLENEKSMKPLFNEILKIDIKLFNLLDLWTSIDDHFDGSSFDPKHIDEEILNSSNYFDSYIEGISPKELKKYLHLKLIDLNH